MCREEIKYYNLLNNGESSYKRYYDQYGRSRMIYLDPWIQINHSLDPWINR